DYEIPVGRRRPLTFQERPLSYPTKHQGSELLTALDTRTTLPHPKMVARICLASGARWGEAQALTPKRLKGNTLIFANSKSK
ncbi:phage integrase, partial [Pseudomonas aeruginosa]